MKQKFNPNDWLNTNEGGDGRDAASCAFTPSPSNDTELVISRIEAAQTDITTNYSDWRNIGFALADEFGEAGRAYYKRISSYYPGYSITDCNKQYDQCMNAKGHGITIKTLFHLAKQAGIDVGTNPGAAVFNRIPKKKPETADGRPETGDGRQETEDRRSENAEASNQQPAASCKESVDVDLPTLPESVYETLPDFLQKVVAVADTKEERDILLLGSLVTLSACLPKVYGLYDGKRVYPNLYLFITAQASAGKGRLVHCKQLVRPVHAELRQQANLMKLQYDEDMREFNSFKGKDIKKEKPMKPPEKMLFIPANNSTTGVFQLLADNEGKGLIFETEGDTLAQAFKSDYGNYSDGFRKAFHHETISYYRRTDREYVEIENPCLSTVLSGTPRQVSTLIPNAENGLFSRFIFYHMNIKPVWKNVFASNHNEGLDEYFNRLGKEFLPLYNALSDHPAIQFCLTAEQQDQFHAFFTQVQVKYLTLQGMDYMATIRRLGLIAFRLAMVLSTLRMLETGDFSDKHDCTEEDFQATLAIVNVLVKHASYVYSELPEDSTPPKQKNRKEQFLDQLPEKFNRPGYLALAKSLSIAEKTAEGYITQFCDKGLIFRDQQSSYTKISK
ncbi:MAG TPA: DNA primase [Prolixibacteraceae bacterium]|nr:DNA primase [Prolixibacteraceae bacterium]